MNPVGVHFRRAKLIMRQPEVEQAAKYKNTIQFMSNCS